MSSYLSVLGIRHTIEVSHHHKDVIGVSVARRLDHAHRFPGLYPQPSIQVCKPRGKEATPNPRLACKKTNKPLRVCDTTLGGFVLGNIQDVLIKALDEPVPEVADSVSLHLSKSLGMLLITKPNTLLDADEVCTVWHDEIVPTVWTNVAEVVGEEVLFASRKPEFPPCDQPLLTREILHKVFDRVERAHEHVKRRVVEHVNEPFAWVDLADRKGTDRGGKGQVTAH